ncbi:MAG TPA: transglycosylase domain-containing protein [Vicinamibacterales bacterium]
MSGRRASALVVATTVMLVAGTIVLIGVSGLYARGSRFLEDVPSLRESDSRVLARPLPIAVGQPVSLESVADHLRRIGYYELPAREGGCFAVRGDSLTLYARFPEFADLSIAWKDGAIAEIRTLAGRSLAASLIEPETLLTVTTDPGGMPSRSLNDQMPFAALAGTPLADALIASEDQWFPTHHGIDFARLATVPITGGGASTITMQVARLDVLRTRRRTLERKLNEIGVAMALERQYSKPAILTAYVNTVYLGVSHGRTVHGFAAAAREFFGVTDVRALTAMQAATLVALLNQPSRYLEDLQRGDDGRLRRQRNRVLRLMNRNFPEKYPDAGEDTSDEPALLRFPPPPSPPLEQVSRHFLDYSLGSALPLAPERTYLTLDGVLQRIAAAAVVNGVTAVERRLRTTAVSRIDAALVATNPRTGELLAMVGGRSYSASQFNRAVSASRQLGSLMKPFDYLAAFERGAEEGRVDLSPDTPIVDLPATFTIKGFKPWRPADYEHEYAGTVTWRRALAESRNVPAVKVAMQAGFRRVASLWEAASGQRLGRVFPSIALGAIQATPAEVARAYAVFATGGMVRPLQTSVTIGKGEIRTAGDTAPTRIARADTAATLADMMQSVLTMGTGRGARAAGFLRPASGKTGTTDDLRDAWFAGFSGDLLAVVWVGRDDNLPLGLTGAQAALPIWTEFMKSAFASR